MCLISISNSLISSNSSLLLKIEMARVYEEEFDSLIRFGYCVKENSYTIL